MKIHRHIHLLLPSLVLACGGDSSGSGDDTTGTGTETSPDDDDDDDDDDDSATDPDAEEDSPVDTTEDPPPTECERTLRFPLYAEQACARVLVGAIDSDSFADVVAFANDGTFIDTPINTTLQTFLGGNLGLDRGEVHCCLETSATGHGAIFDINGDGEGDPLWAGLRDVGVGDVGELQRTLDRIMRGPEGGYTTPGVLFAGTMTDAPPFTVGAITPDTTGVIAIADGALLSLVGTGDELGLEATNTLVLDPTPTIYALDTIELDAMAGVDVVGIGPDGLYLWGGSVTGEFADAMLVELPGDYTDMESIDVDADGNRELVLFGQDLPIALVDRTNMVVVTTEGMPVVSPPATVVEVDNDPYADVVAVEDGSLGYRPFDGDVFGDPILMAPAGTAADLAYGDFNNDGEDDVVVCDDQGILVVYKPG